MIYFLLVKKQGESIWNIFDSIVSVWFNINYIFFFDKLFFFYLLSWNFKFNLMKIWNKNPICANVFLFCSCSNNYFFASFWILLIYTYFLSLCSIYRYVRSEWTDPWKIKIREKKSYASLYLIGEGMWL